MDLESFLSETAGLGGHLLSVPGLPPRRCLGGLRLFQQRPPVVARKHKIACVAILRRPRHPGDSCIP